MLSELVKFIFVELKLNAFEVLDLVGESVYHQGKIVEEACKRSMHLQNRL